MAIPHPCREITPLYLSVGSFTREDTNPGLDPCQVSRAFEPRKRSVRQNHRPTSSALARHSLAVIPVSWAALLARLDLRFAKN